jgi:hypothetical protein
MTPIPQYEAPTVGEFFRSFYHENTYVPEVDLNDDAYLLENEDPEAAQIATNLISNQAAGIKNAFTMPLTELTDMTTEKNHVLLSHDYNLLGERFDPQTGSYQPCHDIAEHPSLAGWTITPGALRMPWNLYNIIYGPSNDYNEACFYTEDDALLSCAMAKRVAQVAQEAGIEVAVAKKWLVRIQHTEDLEENCRKYAVITQKLELPTDTVQKSIQTLQAMDAGSQRDTAQKIATIIRKAGLANASLRNIRVFADGSLAFLDTEPCGLMRAKQHSGSFCQQHSVEKCARVGLFNLMQSCAKRVYDPQPNDEPETEQIDPKLKPFYDQLTAEYEYSLKPKLSKWKIVASIVSLGLLVLISVVIAVVKKRQAVKLAVQIAPLDKQLEESLEKLLDSEVADFISQDPLKYKKVTVKEEMMLKHKLKSKAREVLFKSKDQKAIASKALPYKRAFCNLVEGLPYTPSF